MSWTRCLVISSHPEPCIRYVSYWQSTSYQLSFVLLRNRQYPAHAQISYLGYIRQYSPTEIRWKIISALEEASTRWRNSWISWFRSIATRSRAPCETTLHTCTSCLLLKKPVMKNLFNRPHTKIYIVL